MPIFKCKMCGGALEIDNNETVAVCDYCGTKQTLPRLDDEKRVNMYDRANHFRRNNDFDKASGIYEQILNEDTDDAEAYWSLVLCRYGIEYVEDPSTHKRVPTVNRTQFTSIFDDDNYKSALQYADAYQKTVYEEEAKTINDIQKGIIEISQKEDPFDVFICYKETDNNGRRTHDSVLAADLYHQLTQEGFKVFFSRITLEDKLGTAYEPYIFAALNSAKVMIALGTKPEYFNAVWVKNEWNRYLSIIKQSNGKKVLIPAYRDMDPYDLPEQFSHLQAQDMSKLGFMQDLIRGIRKIIDLNDIHTEIKTVIQSTSNATQLLKRAFMALEDGEFKEANDFLENILNQDAECAQAYLGKLMIDLKINRKEQLGGLKVPFDTNRYFRKIILFGDDMLRDEISGYSKKVLDELELEKKERELAEKKKKEEEKRKKQAEVAELIRKKQEQVQMLQESRSRIKPAENLVFEINNILIKGQKSNSNITSLARNENFDRDKLNLCSNLMPIAAGNLFAVGLKTDGTVIAVGKNSEYQYGIESWKNIISVSARSNRIVGLKLDGTVVATGENDKGQRNVESWKDIISVSAGNEHTVGLKSDGTVVATGRNYDGQCNVKGWSNIISIGAGREHTLGVKSDGTVVATGENFSGQCNVESWRNMISVSAGWLHTVGLKSDGTVVATGYNYFGQCDVDSWKDIISVSAGNDHTVGLKSDGTVVATGRNYDGQCNVKHWRDMVAICAGECFTVGLKSNGTVVATEKYDSKRDYVLNELGHIANICRGSKQIVGLKSDGTVITTGDFDECKYDILSWKDIISASAGAYHVVGLKSDGTALAAGYNEYGQCNVDSWKNIISIGVGYYHTVGLKSDGTVVAIGKNDECQCNVDSWEDIVSVAAGDYYIIGLKSDGTVVATGNLGEKKRNVILWKNIISIRAGRHHIVGLKSDGTVVAIGKNDECQCNVDSWRNIISISAGNNHTVGLKSDGTVVATGYNYFGQCDVVSWRGIVSISACQDRTIGIKTDGTLVSTRKIDREELLNYKLFGNIDTLEYEIITEKKRRSEELEKKRILFEQEEAEKKAIKETERIRHLEENKARIKQLMQEKMDLQIELSNLKGLFTGKKRKELEEKIDNIGIEITSLRADSSNYA